MLGSYFPLRSKHKQLFQRFAVAVIVLICPGTSQASTFSGRVVSVLDGDTIEVLHDGKPERIRLNGIDCPEKGQAFGSRAKLATADMIFGKEITLKTHGRDKYGRTIADVLLPDGTNVNQLLVSEGWCWWYQKHAPKDIALQQSEDEAKLEKKGLWADPDPVPPWLYRRLQSGAYP
jgi:micrococcal nuclease